MLVIYVLYGQTTRVYAGFKGGFYQNFDLKLKWHKIITIFRWIRGDGNLPIFSRHSLGLSAILNVCILHKVHPSKVCLKRIYRVKENVTL